MLNYGFYYPSKKLKRNTLFLEIQRHPKMQRANTVVNRQGVKVDVEFGRLKEYYLSTLAPQKKFVSIRDHVT